MVSFHDLVTSHEDVDTDDGTTDRMSQGPLQAPQLPAKPVLRTLTKLSQKSVVEDVTTRQDRRTWRNEDIDPKQSVDSSMREKLDQSDSGSNISGSITHVSLNRPSFPPLIIPEPKECQRLPSLPPRDRGWAAWRVLIAATVVSSFACGFYLSFGVFRDYYIHDPDITNSSQSALIGVLSSGLPFMAAPVMTYLCQHFSLSRIHYVWIGWAISIIALVGAAFCRTIPTLVVTQGLLFGIGITIADNPMMIIVNTWFIHRRGTVYGIMFGCCDLMGVAWSFLANYLLQHYGIRTTFLVFAAIIAFGSGPCIMLLKERGATSIFRRGSVLSRSKTPDDGVPFSAAGGNFDVLRRDTPPTRQRYFYRPIFWVLITSNLAQAFAVYLPYIYLPSYTTDLGYTSNKGAIVLAVANLAQVVGELGFGKLSDKINVYLLVVISSTTAALSTFFLWGLSKNFGILVAYAFMFGMSGAGFIALWARMGILFGEKDAQMVYSFMCTGRGIGAIISGPISAKLLRSGLDRSMYGSGKYEFLVVFVGASMATSAALGLLGAFTALGNVKNWFQRRASVVKSPLVTRASGMI